MAKKILSVGIDIGTSTTSLVFSNLIIEKTSGEMRMPQTKITDKEIVYRSSVYFTPLKSNTELDAEEISNIVKREYQNAGISPKDVETGAVIITGDTARKSNADKVLNEISDFAGDFVVASAGPSLESILSGKGSGAEQYSIENIDTICNMDIGGGTTNTSVFYDGKCIDADCMDIGGRLIRFTPGTNVIEYVFPKIKAIAQRLGIQAEIGNSINMNQISAITDVMAKAMLEKLKLSPDNVDFNYLCTETKENRKLSRKVNAVTFSGGVGKLIYDGEMVDKFAYDDIGVCLADSIKNELKKLDVKLVKPKETIAATVIGAGNHSVDVSGGTITITNLDSLPLKNLPIVKINEPVEMSYEVLKEEIGKQIHWVQGLDGCQEVALCFTISQKLGFKDISRLAEKIVEAASDLFKQQKILVVIVQGDYGKVLGQCIKQRLPKGKEIVCIDSIDATQGDYIDIGKPIGIADAVPVVIKTIAFSY